jgi:hypothetical protein
MYGISKSKMPINSIYMLRRPLWELISCERDAVYIGYI